MLLRSLIRTAFVTVALLLVPAAAMQFTDAVDWSLADFLVAGALLFGAGLTYDRLARRNTSVSYRAAVGAAVGTALMVVWISVAVGLP